MGSSHIDFSALRLFVQLNLSTPDKKRFYITLISNKNHQPIVKKVRELSFSFTL